jgi:hypothetical protein
MRLGDPDSTLAPRFSGETTHRPITQAPTRDSALALGIERRIMDPELERSPVAYLPEAPATWGPCLKAGRPLSEGVRGPSRANVVAKKAPSR